MRVLVADDDALLRRSLKLQLMRAGHDVVEADNGEAALDLLQREAIRLLITDWQMPGMNGLELVRRVRAAGGPGYVYIIVLTANSLKRDIIAGLEAGADDYLVKPFDAGELGARVSIGVRILNLEGRLTQSLAHVEELAVRDGLTGLYNRRALDQRLADEMQRAARYLRPLSLLIIDVDYFKQYNDTHGHPQGDELLRQLAGVFEASLRSTDMVARYGGDEFVVLLPETSLAKALTVARAIHARVAASPFPLAETLPGGKVTVSIGLAEQTGQRSTPASLLEAADQALYQAKNGGRSRVVTAD